MIATSLHQIEVTSTCNLRCAYCLWPTMTRPKVHISEAHWQAALTWVRHFVRHGTQGELLLFGTGEPFLHPDFPRFAMEAREVIGPGRRLVTTSNGLAVTPELVDALRPSGIRVYVSLHRPEKAEKAARLLWHAGLLEDTVVDAVMSPNSWGGQVQWYDRVTDREAGATVDGPKAAPYDKRPVCPWTGAGWLFVAADGTFRNCCYANGDTPVMAMVTDAPTGLDVQPWSACGACWQRQLKPGEVYEHKITR